MQVTSNTLYHAFTKMVEQLDRNPSINNLYATIERGQSLLAQYQRFDDHAPHLADQMQRKLDQLEENYNAALQEENDLDQTCSTAGSLLKFANTWVGDDLQDCLEAAIQNRSESQF